MPNETLKTLTMPIKSGGTTTAKTYDIPQGDVKQTELDSLLTDYAKKDGTYEDLVAGSANQLIPSAMETESVPYNFRTAGGSLDIGDREFDKLVGLSLPWNQIISTNGTAFLSGDSTTVNGVTITGNRANGELTVNGTATADGQIQFYDSLNDSTAPILRANQAYYLKQPTGASSSTYWLRTGEDTFWNYKSIGKLPSSYSQTGYNMRFFFKSGQTFNNFKVKPQFFNLTQTFGSTIADYIASLETATAGAGVALFKKFFPKQYYAFQSGKIESVKVSSHDMVGFNQLDLANVYNSTYFNYADGTLTNKYTDSITALKVTAQIYNGTTWVENVSTLYTSATGKYTWKFNIGSNEGTRLQFKHNGSSSDLPMFQITKWLKNTTYVLSFELVKNDPSTAGGLVIKDLCLHLAWDDSRNGEYEPYVKHSYALDPIELRGILKLDSNNEPYADGDTYEADGTVTRKYGIVDLGTLNWTYSSNSQRFGSNETFANVGVPTVPTYPSRCGKYTNYYTGANIELADMPDKTFIFGSARWSSSRSAVIIHDSAYTDATALKTALNGVYLVYPLATPTTESADPFTDPQTVDNWGTEQYVDKAYTDGDRDVEIPVGHETKYPMNLRDKLETAPNAPTSDGDYIVQSASGQLSYVALGSTTTIQNIIARLEALEG